MATAWASGPKSAMPFLQAPWFGYGWNQTAAAQIAVAGAHPGDMTFTYAHNIVLDLLLWNGLPLGILITLACGYWFVTRMLRARNVEAVYAMAALLPFAMHSMVEFPFAYAYFLITAGLLIGIVEASTARRPPITVSTRWLWPVLAVWAGVGSVIAFEYFQVEEDFRIVRFENLRIGTTPSSYEVPEIHRAHPHGHHAGGIPHDARAGYEARANRAAAPGSPPLCLRRHHLPLRNRAGLER